MEFVVAGIAWPLSALRGLPWLGRSVRGVLGTGRAPRVVLTALWSVVAVLVFGLLFVSADAVVADWVDGVLPDLTIESFVLRCFVGVFVGGATLAAAYLALNPPDVSAVPGRRGRGDGAPLRVAGAGAARRRGVRACSWPRRRPCCSAATTTCSAPPGSPTPSTCTRASAS